MKCAICGKRAENIISVAMGLVLGFCAVHFNAYEDRHAKPLKPKRKPRG